MLFCRLCEAGHHSRRICTQPFNCIRPLPFVVSRVPFGQNSWAFECARVWRICQSPDTLAASAKACTWRQIAKLCNNKKRKARVCSLFGALQHNRKTSSFTVNEKETLWWMIPPCGFPSIDRTSRVCQFWRASHTKFRFLHPSLNSPNIGYNYNHTKF